MIDSKNLKNVHHDHFLNIHLHSSFLPLTTKFMNVRENPQHFSNRAYGRNGGYYVPLKSVLNCLKARQLLVYRLQSSQEILSGHIGIWGASIKGTLNLTDSIDSILAWVRNIHIFFSMDQNRDTFSMASLLTGKMSGRMRWTFLEIPGEECQIKRVRCCWFTEVRSYVSVSCDSPVYRQICE